MHRDSERLKLFSRRAAMLAGGQAVLMSSLIGRMYYLQVVESERYVTLAEDNRINLRLLAPPRGEIVDRAGVALAVNQQNYQVVLIPEQTRDVDETLTALRSIISISESDERKVTRELKRKRGFVPVTIRENLNWEQVARIEVNTPDLPGVMIHVGQSRFYPHGEETAHLLGYVAAVSEKEQTGDPLLELPGFRIGKAGVEKIYDKQLRGSGGSSQVEVNAYGRVIRELSRREGQPGAKVKMTFDLGLQKKVIERLGEQSAAAVVLDVHSGEVLALSSTPSFDPNAFNRGLEANEWKALIRHPRFPLTNKAIAGQYAPGSTFKMAVALAALDKGVINEESQVFCSGSTRLGNAKFHCWKRGGHGRVNVSDAIKKSCDVFFYEAARRTGINRIAEMARRLGMGETLGIELPGEQKGLLPTEEWKLARHGVPWQGGETLIAGIGQGFILTTPLQLAVMAARLANGGNAIVPHLIKKPPATSETDDGSDGATETKSIGLSQAHLKIVREAMINVVNSPSGTAYRARIKESGFEMAGKTGTVQVRRITKAEREQGVIKNKDLPWKERDHALFVGFAPIHQPRYAAAVVVEHGGGGSSVAAPIVRDILLEAQKRGSSRLADASTAPAAGFSAADDPSGT